MSRKHSLERLEGISLAKPIARVFVDELSLAAGGLGMRRYRWNGCLVLRNLLMLTRVEAIGTLDRGHSSRCGCQGVNGA